jgi:DNA-binding MarR family transcriptional regulator
MNSVITTPPHHRAGGSVFGMADMSAAVDAEATALVALFEAARVQASTRLSASQLQALLVVEDDEGLNLGTLADRLGVILSSASRLCDRLVAAGMLEREPGPTDRREVCLTLTADGRDVLAGLRADRRGRLAGVLASMTPAGRDALLRGLREFARIARYAPSEADGAAARSA